MARSMPFGHLDIGYDDRVLEPRPWTSSQSHWAAELLGGVAAPARVLELCAGAGQIGLLALSLAGAPVTPHRLVTVDVNPVACDHARKNAASNGLAPCTDVREGGIDDAVGTGERFDLVIADPPWVAQAETSRYPDDPLVAIDGGPDGLDIAWQCIRAGERHLVTGGSVLLQLGSSDQARLVECGLADLAPTLAMRECRRFGTRGVLVLLVKAGDEAAAC